MKLLSLFLIATMGFSLSNGVYACISEKIIDLDTGFYKKIPEKDMQVIKFRVTNDGETIQDKSGNWDYSFSKDNIDIYSKKDEKLLLAFPSKKFSKNDIFRGGVFIPDNKQEIILLCKKTK